MKKAINDFNSEYLTKINPMLNVRINKVVVNVGLKGKKEWKGVTRWITKIADQKPIKCLARRAISGFKVKKGDLLGVKITLRRSKAYNFLKKFVLEVMENIPAFRGFSVSSFDKFGNFNFGVSEQIFFPQVNFEDIDVVKGLGINIVFNDNYSSKELKKKITFNFLKDFGFKFCDSI